MSGTGRRLTASEAQSIFAQLPVWQSSNPSPDDVQFVRAHTRPFQSDDTSSDLFAPAASSKPPVLGPVPLAVYMPGHSVSGHLLYI